MTGGYRHGRKEHDVPVQSWSGKAMSRRVGLFQCLPYLIVRIGGGLASPLRPLFLLIDVVLGLHDHGPAWREG